MTKEFENTVRVSGILEKRPYVGDSKFGGKYTYFKLTQRYPTKAGLKQQYFDCQYEDDIFRLINEDDVGQVRLSITGELINQKSKNKDGVEYYTKGIKAHTITPDLPQKTRKPMANPAPVTVMVNAPKSDADEDLPF